MKILWFKKNLRVTDSALLSNLDENEEALGVYLFEKSILSSPDFSNFHLQFILDSLRDLEKNLKTLGIPLLFLEKEAVEGFEFLANLFPYGEILSYEETGNNLSYKRDKSLKKWCNTKHIALKEFPTNGVVRGLKNRDNWTKIWNTRMNTAVEKIRLPLPFSLSKELQNISKNTFLRYEKNFERNDKIQVGGEEAGKKVLDSFLTKRSENYIYSISHPQESSKGCSRLSAYITYGNLSIRSIYQASLSKIEFLKEQNSEKAKRQIKNIHFFLARLHWQSHFIQKFEDEVEMERKNVSREFDTIRTQTNEGLIEKVFEGMSGIPLIDAIARCLKTGGRINFRSRATFVSFLCNTLLQPWQSIATKLAQVFVDYEPGIHYPQLQMQAGTSGINTIRIYNPIKQAEEKDKEKRFIRYWIPEIAHLDNEDIADPKFHPENLLYPKSIVDIEEANRYARKILWETKRKIPREIKNLIIQKHASRKNTSKNKTKLVEAQIGLF